MAKGWMPLLIATLCGACVAPVEQGGEPAPSDEVAADPLALPATGMTKAPAVPAIDKPWRWSTCQVAGGCDDDNPCTQDSCEVFSCKHVPISGSCDDGDPCTLADHCAGGYCAGSARVSLLTGVSSPAEEGWTAYGDGEAAWSDGASVVVSTADLEAAEPYAIYARDLHPSLLAHHDLEWKMAVSVGTHDPFDAGVAFLPAYSGDYGVDVERAQMIYFEPGGVGWGDESQAAWFDVSVERTYRLHVDPNGESRLYVDGEIALTREQIHVNGTIGFGDQTDDAGVDGAFTIREMALVPALSCASSWIE